MTCKKCKVCTKHKFDTETNTWARCKNADISIFYKELENIPHAYITKTWSDWTSNTPNRKLAQDYASTIYSRLSDNVLPKLQVVFTGPRNSGKTLITSILARHLILAHIETSFISLDMLTHLFFNSRQDYITYYNQKCLIIQITTEPQSNAIQLVLNDINRQRSLRNNYTIYTINSNIQKLKDKYSQEVQDFFQQDTFKEIQLQKWNQK